jgi:hypothetical protein
MMPGLDTNPRPDDQEAAMARADLYKLANYSFKLFKMIKDGDQLEGWVQAKVTKAADYIASVYHYLEYEMKFSEYGSRLENSDMYSESVKKMYLQKLTEARAMLDKMKERAQLDEGWEDMMKAVHDNKGTGKFDKKEIKPGVTQYTRKSSTFTDGGDDKDTKDAKKKAKKVKEGNEVTPAQGQALMKSKDPNAYNKMKGIKTPAKTTTAVSDPEGVPAKPVKEATKAKKDYDGDGKVESPKDEVWGSRAKAAAKSGKPFKESAKPDYIDLDKDGNKKEPMKKAAKDAKVKEASEKCNHTPKGKSCPVHGLKECGSMYEASHQAKTTMKHVKNPTAGEKKAAKDIKPGVKGYADRVAMLKSAEKDGRLKTEALKGGQKKLDVDKDGKLEKSDFAKLRASKAK